MLNLKNVDKNWTLFLDRDGVINHDKIGSYIFNAEEFRFYDGVTDAMKIFHQLFGHIVIVTNQRGVGKGLMSELDLMQIHNKMLQETEAAGGRIDAIYYATSLDNNHPERKPHSGMALKAKADLPEIDFSKSIMVGNNLSDMEFGRKGPGVGKKSFVSQLVTRRGDRAGTRHVVEETRKNHPAAPAHHHLVDEVQAAGKPLSFQHRAQDADEQQEPIDWK